MVIIYKVRIKQGDLITFQKLVDETLIPEAHKLQGCRLFSIYQNTTNEREFIFHELWNNEESVHAYKQNLVAILGPPHPGEEFPAAMNDLIEEDEDLV